MDTSKLKAAGFKDDEIEQYQATLAAPPAPQPGGNVSKPFDVTANTVDVQKLADAGFSEKDITDYIAGMSTGYGAPAAQGTPPPSPEEEPSTLVKLNRSLGQRGQNIATAATTPTSVPWRPPIRIAGELAGTVMDVAGAGAKGAYEALVPDVVRSEQKTYLRDLSEYWKAGLPDTPVIKAGVNAIKQGAKYWDWFQKAYPEEAKDISSVVDIAAFIPGWKGAEVVGAPAKELAGKAAGKAAGGMERWAARRVPKETLDIVSRDLGQFSKEQLREARAKGWVEGKGFLRNERLKVTPMDREVAQSVEGIVKKSNGSQKNIDLIHDAISKTAEKTAALPREFNAAFDPADLQFTLDAARAESEDVVAALTGERKYQQMSDIFKEIVGKKSSNLSSVLEARQEFDKAIDAKFGPKVWRNDTVMSRAVKDIRMAANDFVASKLPEGNEFKALLRQQTNMFRAIDRIAAKMPKNVGAGTVRRAGKLMSAHPWITAEAAAAIGSAGTLGVMSHYGVGGALLNVVSSPLIMSALATYGAVRIGKGIWTSDMVRTGLSKFLRSAERYLISEDKEALGRALASLSKEPLDTTFADELARIERAEAMHAPIARGESPVPVTGGRTMVPTNRIGVEEPAPSAFAAPRSSLVTPPAPPPSAAAARGTLPLTPEALEASKANMLLNPTPTPGYVRGVPADVSTPAQRTAAALRAEAERKRGGANQITLPKSTTYYKEGEHTPLVSPKRVPEGGQAKVRGGKRKKGRPVNPADPLGLFEE